MNIYIILTILTAHWIFDFAFQTEWQATNKSKDITALLGHTVIYSLSWCFLAFIYSDMTNNPWFMLFVPITFVAHTITDYYTSKAHSMLADEARATGNWHNFFVSIGLDQLLHYFQLFLTFKLLT